MCASLRKSYGVGNGDDTSIEGCTTRATGDRTQVHRLHQLAVISISSKLSALLDRRGITVKDIKVINERETVFKQGPVNREQTVEGA